MIILQTLVKNEFFISLNFILPVWTKVLFQIILENSPEIDKKKHKLVNLFVNN